MRFNKEVNSTFLILFLLILGSCITPYEPAATFEDKQKEKESEIEKHVEQSIRLSEDSLGIYESLAYGDLIVYKPAIFYSLDSLYAIKDNLIRSNKERELLESDLELYIEEYRVKAQEQIGEIRYEIEHIYCIRGATLHTICSEIFYLDNNDSIISTFNKFRFTIPRNDYVMYKNYLFEMHFTTPRELYISENERDFVQLFKSKELQLYKSEDHEKFIRHTLKLMNVASTINTVDYVSMTKALGTAILSEKQEEIELLEIGALIAVEDVFKQVISYEIDFKWTIKDNQKKDTLLSILEFDPYLRVININEYIEN